MIQRLRGAPQRGFVDKLRANAAAWYGMLLAHLGVAVFIVGVTLVKGYEIERDVRLEVGQSVDVAGDTYTFRGVAPRRGSELRRDGRDDRRRAQRHDGRDAASAEARVSVIGPGDDRGRHPDARSPATVTCRSASR